MPRTDAAVAEEHNRPGGPKSTVVTAGQLPANRLRLFEAVDSERCERDRKAKVHQAAKAAVQEASQEMARLQGRSSEEEREIAMSGGPIPRSSALDEQLAQASRKKRILLIREKAASEEVSACEARIQPIIAEIRTAWAEYGKQVYRERLAAFGAAAMELVDRWLDMAALVNADRKSK